MNNQPLAVEAWELKKFFDKTAAVDGINLRVPVGGVYGFLGPNGAGKTTTIRMLATLLRPDAGTASVFGYDIVREAGQVRRRIGLTGQFASVDEDLTGRENLILLARLLGYSWPQARQRADELLEAFELTAAASRQIKTYSGGMKRRMDIAASIVVTPELLFLDEPTTGLDPRSRNHVWEIVRAMVTGGTTMMLTTQNLEEADQLAGQIAVIDRGKIIAEGTGGELKAAVGAGSLRVRLDDTARRTEAERVLSDVIGVPVVLEADPAELSARVDNMEVVTRALSGLSQSGIGVTSFSFGKPSLDEVFLKLTGRDVTIGSDT